MIPSKLVILSCSVIRKLRLTGNGVQVTYLEVAAVLVAFCIHRAPVDIKTAFRINIRCQCQVKVITDTEIITDVLQKKSAARRLTNAWKNQARASSFLIRKKTKWNEQGSGNCFDGKKSRTGYNLVIA